MRPQLQLTELQIADLTATGVYVAGCTDPAVRSRDDLYDIFVDGECGKYLVWSNSGVLIAWHVPFFVPVPGASISAAKSAQGCTCLFVYAARPSVLVST